MKRKPYIRQVENAKTAVLMIHGIVGSPIHFKDLLPLIPDDWSIYNILLDGHGKEVEDFSHTSMAKWQAQVEQQLNQLRATYEQVLIIGHSMGALLSLQQAIRCPDQIMGLFLLNVPFCPFVRPSTFGNSIKAARGSKNPSPAVQAILSATSVNLTKKFRKYIGWIPRFWELLVQIRRTRKMLPQLQVPTLTFQSRRDELVSFRSCRHLTGHPYITNFVLEKSGHFGYHEDDLQTLQAQLKNMIQKYC